MLVRAVRLGLPEASVPDEQQAGAVGVADAGYNPVTVTARARSTHRVGLSCTGWGEREGRAGPGSCTAFEHFCSVLPEEICLWAEQTLWGWGLAVF